MVMVFKTNNWLSLIIHRLLQIKERNEWTRPNLRSRKLCEESSLSFCRDHKHLVLRSSAHSKELIHRICAEDTHIDSTIVTETRRASDTVHGRLGSLVSFLLTVASPRMGTPVENTSNISPGVLPQTIACNGLCASYRTKHFVHEPHLQEAELV